ncbi:cell division protein FtsQ/DivIB [Desulfobotulus sp.]|uniref:cell division protein FtsQ/DivIB n=1 Tax=Desulfobotulus sp. TaxID=1940337 RepID=UPI002A36BAA9|nr:FtsQ-type POTRA domain-containing protein [Desulfobotulus sp.]MDY0164005.1 FtsQ-type POTRA domain-containing protein [Desulfobotulus sp.]
MKPARSDRLSRKPGGRRAKPNRKKQESRPWLVPGQVRTWGLRGAGVLLLALGLVFTHDLITQSAYFQIHTIRIQGEEYLDRERILQQAAIPEKSNLMALNLRLVRLRLEAHPWIREAAVTRRLPHTLEITVMEEEPFAIVHPETMPDKAFWANRDGRIFKELEADDPVHAYPRMRDLPFSDTQNRHLWFSRARTLLDLLQENEEPSLSAGPPPVLWIDPDLGLSLSDTAIAARILFGFSDFREKNLKLRTLLQHRREHRQTTPMDTIDLVRPDRVVVIPAAA